MKFSMLNTYLTQIHTITRFSLVRLEELVNLVVSPFSSFTFYFLPTYKRSAFADSYWFAYSTKRLSFTARKLS